MLTRRIEFTPRKYFGVAWLALALCGGAACEDEADGGRGKFDAAASGSSDSGANDSSFGDAASNGSLTDTGAGDAAVLASEVVGFYSGDWGDMVLKQVGNEIWGAYTHDQGTLVGTFQAGVLVGWWSEVPSRLPTNDAGEVEFRFGRKSDGTIFFDGRWKYGSAEAWRENWDIAQVKLTPPSLLVDRFNDVAAFKRHP